MPSRSSSAVADAAAPARLMLRNVGYNLAGRIWLFALTVAATPILVHGLGAQLFALYSLVGALAGYFAVLDFGFGIATIKFVAEYRGRRDDEAIGRMIGSAITAFLALGILGALVLVAGASFLVERVLDVPPEMRSVARTAVGVTALGFIVTMPLSVLNAIPMALQRMDIVNRRNALFGTVLAVGTVVLIKSGHGIVAVIGYGVIVNAVAAVSFAVTTKRLLPGISLRPRLHPAALRTLGGFGAMKFINQVATNTVYHLDKLLIAVLAPLAAVTPYVIALTLAQRLSLLVGNVAGAFLPAASEAHGGADHAGFKDLYLRGTKLVGLLVFPLGMLLIVFADPILLHWVGGEVARDSAGLLRLLAVAYVVNALSTMPAVACDSLSRPGVTTAFSVGSAALNVALAVILIPHFGAAGAGLAILVNSVLLVPVFLAYVHRRVLRVSLAELARRSLARPAAATLLLVPVALILRAWATTLPLLLLSIGATFGLYVALTVALGAYDAADRGFVATLRPRRKTLRRATVEP